MKLYSKLYSIIGKIIEITTNYIIAFIAVPIILVLYIVFFTIRLMFYLIKELIIIVYRLISPKEETY